MNRREFIKKIFVGVLGISVLSALDGFFIEPRIFRRKDVTVPLDALPEGFNGFRMAHFSDVHIGKGLTAEDLIPLVGKINRAKPDMVVFTGDLLDYEMSELNKTAEVLGELTAPYGKFAVLGNHDVWEEIDTEQLLQSYRAAGFKPLVNENVRIVHRDTGTPLYLAGLDDAWGYPSWSKTFGGIPPDSCTIALIHEPNLADRAKKYNVSLQLSGHSHGGQVRLPFIGATVYPPLGDKYSDGLQKADKSDMWVHTSRGIGMTKLPVRFLCPPEWHIITLCNRA
ncbi:metallophosphoesterase [Aneurinibacillus tyrosinisolvens]|uniref:metallophosphoesterase n=1 Tax=Aneurinibacillus tyrosinisolvens TaxID=1443435 RepID=UPI00063F1446|nr:metallophosphoesterase [Aneurinibacillus tyrosinisolvens]